MCLSKHLLCLWDDVETPGSLPLMPSRRQDGGAIRAMFAGIAERYDLANHLLSGGLDFLWRKRAARCVSGWKPRRILDLATGSGDLALAIKAATPEAMLVSADFCHPMLLIALRKRLQNLVVADALSLPFTDECFDVLTIGFGLRNVVSWNEALAEFARVIRPGGHLLVLDFSVPPVPLRWIYRPYLHHFLPQIATLLTGDKAAYRYLAESIEAFPSGIAMCRLIESCGFINATSEFLSGGIVSLYTAERF